jgi:hypothetical protein
MRNYLFLASFSAARYNAACRKLYERLVERGKPKKVALVAVANKLLAQALAIAKSGKGYQADYSA